MRARQARNLAVVLATILVLSAGFNNCGARTTRDESSLGLSEARGGTSGGNPARTQLRFSPYDPATAEPLAGALLKSFTICATEFHFRSQADGADYVVAYNSELEILPDGTTVADLTIPRGDYDQVTVVMRNTCGTGASMVVTNGLVGRIPVSDPVKMTFEGGFSSDSREHALTLDLAAISRALAISADTQQAITSVSGVAGLFPSDFAGLAGTGP